MPDAVPWLGLLLTTFRHHQHTTTIGLSRKLAEKKQRELAEQIRRDAEEDAKAKATSVSPQSRIRI